MLVYNSLRGFDGQSDKLSRGYLLDKENRITHFGSDAVKFSVEDWWHRDKGTKYSIKWRMDIAPIDLSLVIEEVPVVSSDNGILGRGNCCI